MRSSSYRPELLLLREHWPHCAVSRVISPWRTSPRRQYLGRRLVETHSPCADAPENVRHQSPDERRRPRLFRRAASHPNLRGFLDATGWTCLSASISAPTRPSAWSRRSGVRRKGSGPKLEYFQLGNEPDLFDRLCGIRKRGRRRLPGRVARHGQRHPRQDPRRRFGLPDTSGNPQWSRIADRLSVMNGCPGSGTSYPGYRPAIAAISHHYYFTGPPSNPQSTSTAYSTPTQVSPATAATTRAAATSSVPNTE